MNRNKILSFCAWFVLCAGLVWSCKLYLQNSYLVAILPDSQIIKTIQVANVSQSTSKNISNIDQVFSVIRVVDGDTIVVKINGTDEKVRLIGINTPETVDPRKPVECFGKEASDKTKELLNNQKVILKNDPTQSDRDKYSRLLRYVFRNDGLFINQYLVAEGFAYEYTYDVPYKYQKGFKQAQLDAKNSQKGLWKDGVCLSNNVK